MITLVVCGLLGALGWWNGLPYWWIAAFSATAEVIYRPFGAWADSGRVGSSAVLSAFLKMIVQMFGALSSLGFWASLLVACYWAYLSVSA